MKRAQPGLPGDGASVVEAPQPQAVCSVLCWAVSFHQPALRPEMFVFSAYSEVLDPSRLTSALKSDIDNNSSALSPTG